MDKQTVSIKRSVATISLGVALLIGGALTWAFTSSDRPVLGASRPVELRMAPAAAKPAVGPVSLSEGFSAVVEPLLPAVVNISSSKMVKATRGQNPFEDDPMFRQFFGNPFGGDNGQGNGQGQAPRQQKEHSLGSGVIVSPDGYILTNNHVVDGATDITVTLKDKRDLKAKLVGADPRTDIAVLKIPATGLASVTLGDSTKLRVGDIVLAVGDPFGIGETVTMGIVSATSRRALDIEGSDNYEDFIQTDAAINPGNSGGALVNTRGELIGINTAIISNGGGGGNQGIGFAVPVDMARRVMEQILKTGKVTRGYLGVIIQGVTPDLAKAFGLPSADGALVGDVTPGGPGAKAGLQKGDVIVTLNGQAVSDSQDLRLRISQLAPGETVKLQLYRNGQKRDISATLQEFPEKKETAEAPATDQNAAEGLQVENLSPDVAEQLNLPAGTRGVVVSRVDPDSNAAEALQRGDVIQEVNHKPVNNVDQFRAAMNAAGNQPMLLLINRGGNTAFAVLRPKE
jgi:serine protease Do